MTTDLIINLVAEDRSIIGYRPSFARLTGSVTAAILLQQMIFRFTHHNGTPFYKFKQVCRHELYRAGDSWCEELGFSRNEFENALKVIGTKIKKTNYKSAIDWNEDVDLKTTLQHVVIYWTDIQRMTWYCLNMHALRKVINSLYSKETFSLYDKVSNSLYQYTETTSETTSKTTEQELSSDDGTELADTPERVAIEEKTNATPNAEPVLSPPSSGEPPSIYQQIFGAVQEVWGHNGFRAGNIAAIIAGVSDNKGWMEYNFDPPGNPIGVKVFGKWYPLACKGANLPEDPVAVQTWYYKMRTDYRLNPHREVFGPFRAEAAKLELPTTSRFAIFLDPAQVAARTREALEGDKE